MQQRQGRIILLNGTSSAGKTTLAHALRPALPQSFHYYASDQLADAGFRPLDEDERWQWRETFFHGFHRSIAAFASAGLDLLVEHIVEQQSWADELRPILAPFDTFWVGVHAHTQELTRREAARGDRHSGEALEHLQTHSFCRYDVEVDTTQPLPTVVERVVSTWTARRIT